VLVSVGRTPVVLGVPVVVCPLVADPEVSLLGASALKLPVVGSATTRVSVVVTELGLVPAPMAALDVVVPAELRGALVGFGSDAAFVTGDGVAAMLDEALGAVVAVAVLPLVPVTEVVAAT
jgi:hypothetical protein